jgi:hypothetical protein
MKLIDDANPFASSTNMHRKSVAVLDKVKTINQFEDFITFQ